MPPMSGWGMGVERFLALLTGQDNLREVVLFPLMKPLVRHDTAPPTRPGHREVEHEALDPAFAELLGQPADDVGNLGITPERARELFDEWVTTPSLRRQMEMASVVMGALARRRGANEEAWRTIGLLHNLDFDREKDPLQHTLPTARVLQDEGVHPAAIHAICAHNDEGLARTGIRCISALDHAVSCAEAVVGLLHAAAQVLPSKSIGDLKVKSALKRHRKATFAVNVERHLIERCAGLGLDLDVFYGLAIEALREEPVPG